jgi:hypothetical protein
MDTEYFHVLVIIIRGVLQCAPRTNPGGINYRDLVSAPYWWSADKYEICCRFGNVANMIGSRRINLRCIIRRYKPQKPYYVCTMIKIIVVKRKMVSSTPLNSNHVAAFTILLFVLITTSNCFFLVKTTAWSKSHMFLWQSDYWRISCEAWKMTVLSFWYPTGQTRTWPTQSAWRMILRQRRTILDLKVHKIWFS